MIQFEYEQALAFIHGTHRTGVKVGLRNMEALLDLLGNPQERFVCVHIGGTNGKGSVCAFVDAALRRAGYKTGLYTSPFLQRYNERMRVDGVPIGDRRLADLAARVAEAAGVLARRDIHPTEFEIGTALAFLLFAEEAVDMAVVEVGLGGRLDPTNVLQPVVAAIAAIGLDHTTILGETLEAIAGEKAGIVKAGTPLVLSAQNGPAVRQVIQARCEQVGAAFHLAEPVTGLPLGLKGQFQAYNAGVAAEVLRLLASRGFSRLTREVVAQGLGRARWPGRLEWVEGCPPLLLDGAHNAQGAQALAEYLASLPPRRTALVCGMMQDKDSRAMAEIFAGMADCIYTVAPDNPRSIPAAALAAVFEDTGVQARPCASLTEAIDVATDRAGQTGQVVIAGSLYLVGAARTLLALDDGGLMTPACEEE